MPSRRQQSKPSAIVVSTPGKILYRAGKFTKTNVVDTIDASRAIFSHISETGPVTLKPFRMGFRRSVHEKDAPGFTPKWVKTFPVRVMKGGPEIKCI